MITYVKGELSEIYGNYIVVETGGVGYEMMVPSSITGALPALGSDVKIYTYQYVKEDALDLYGFLSRDDLNIFKLLITVNGIGPKGALNILSVITPDDLRLAVLSDDVKRIQSAPGIGAKTAQKLIIELKDKLSLEDVLTKGVSGGAAQSAQNANGPRDEAIEALVALGYSSSESIRAVREVEITEDADGEAVLKAALKKLAFM
ncbi:MAG: Holliday junction branch migration protein RuvA [Butyrivibrio sp.]|nr:Holliday junction branch migration protein RuvA [Butyrivibrio sp.]